MTLVSVDTTEPSPLRAIRQPVSAATEDKADEEWSTAYFLRQSVEFIVMLVLIILIFRTFAAEAYIVPTGSMAPTLLGNHREIRCINCAFRFTLGIDEGGKSGTALCPNCGQSGLDDIEFVESTGDRVLVQKFLYDVRRPRRWERQPPRPLLPLAPLLPLLRLSLLLLCRCRFCLRQRAKRPCGTRSAPR